MIPENLIALAKVIRVTGRFEMSVICARLDPTAHNGRCTWDESVTPRAMWDDKDIVGDYGAWANCISEHRTLDDEDHAAEWMGLTMEEFDQINYLDVVEDRKSLWLIHREHYGLTFEHDRLDPREITSDKAADMLDRLVKGEVSFADGT